MACTKQQVSMTPFLNDQIVKYQTTCIDQSVCDRLIRAPIIKGTFLQSLFTLSIFFTTFNLSH